MSKLLNLLRGTAIAVLIPCCLLIPGCATSSRDSNPEDIIGTGNRPEQPAKESN